METQVFNIKLDSGKETKMMINPKVESQSEKAVQVRLFAADFSNKLVWLPKSVIDLTTYTMKAWFFSKEFSKKELGGF